MALSVLYEYVGPADLTNLILHQQVSKSTAPNYSTQSDGSTATYTSSLDQSDCRSRTCTTCGTTTRRAAASAAGRLTKCSRRDSVRWFIKLIRIILDTDFGSLEIYAVIFLSFAEALLVGIMDKAR